MNRSARNLANLPDDRLFNEVSEGIKLIVENAISLDNAAKCLHQEKQFRVSKIIRGFSKEEAAKVLILIDLIRCPLKQQHKVKIANRFYNHLIKRIYASVCSHPVIASFGELNELIEMKCRRYYLDGPNDVDWIFPNSIIAEREQTLYVDYVQDITEEPGNFFWIEPFQFSHEESEYETSNCVKLSYFLSEAGAGSPEGLAAIADLWRSFIPVLETDRTELRNLIQLTLERLSKSGAGIESAPYASFVYWHWSFPLWSLKIEDYCAKSENLKELRRERSQIIDWMESINAKREPSPKISRSKVEALNNAYIAWRKEVNAQIVDMNESREGGILFRESSDIEKDYELPSFHRVKKLFCALTEEERAALLALGWYGNETGEADWPKIYERAINSVATLDEEYQIHYGHRWMDGQIRWESTPKPFKPGQLYRV